MSGLPPDHFPAPRSSAGRPPRLPSWPPGEPGSGLKHGPREPLVLDRAGEVPTRAFLVGFKVWYDQAKHGREGVLLLVTLKAPTVRRRLVNYQRLVRYLL